MIKMLKMRKEIIKYMCIITMTMTLIILLISVILQIYNDRKKVNDESLAVFSRIKQIMSENEKELAEIRDEYSHTCLYKAATIARILQNEPSVMDSVGELEEIAAFTQVDEIHIFDKTGTIVKGTHPEYYSYSFDSGEQMAFFKPMLEDKSLKLVQDITPNTAENKLMQYSALWSEDGEFIVQIGMEPVKVKKVTEKNELSYIFSMLRANPGIELYAVDPGSGRIVGSTSPADNEKNLSDIGIDPNMAMNRTNGFHTSVKGVNCFCIFTNINSNLVGRVIPKDVLYANLLTDTLELAVGLLFIAAILVTAVSSYMNKYVISGIYAINEKLRSISGGNLDETVHIHTSHEFSELSCHINEMVNTLLADTEKISYVLNKTNLHIGVYEYNENMHGVRATEYLPAILNIKDGKSSELFTDHHLFREYIDRLRLDPIIGMENVYCADSAGTHYVRLDEVRNGSDILGIAIDVTDEVFARRKIEKERDIDPLTGLYNRRGLEGKLRELFAAPEKIGHGALIMIDSDGLKSVNDRYGHDMGDIYLKKLSEAVNSFGKNCCIAARQGGDEFVIFLYDYPNEEELTESIETLKYIQNNSTAHLRPDLCVPLNFSFGYSLTNGHDDYKELLRSADEKMYKNKRRGAPAGRVTPDVNYG